jgi:hypothetical protein
MIFGTAHMNRCKYRLLYCAHCWSEVGRALGRNCSEDAGVWSQKVAASAIALFNGMLINNKMLVLKKKC